MKLQRQNLTFGQLSLVLLGILLTCLSFTTSKEQITCTKEELMNQRPVAICQSIFRIADVNCQGSASAVDFDSGSYDPDGDPLSFSVFPTGPYPNGTTTVELTITDIDGATATCYPSILVQDNTAPTFDCLAAIILLDNNGMATLTPPEIVGNINDNCSSGTASISPSTFTCAQANQNVTINITVTDAVGNAATCTTFITVRDLNNICPLPPDAICQNLTLSANGNCLGQAQAIDFDNGSSDPNGDPLSYLVNPTGPYPLGATSVVLTVTDSDGESATCAASVTVVDSTPPSATCQDITVQLDPSGVASIGGTDVFLGFNAPDRFINSGQSIGSFSSSGAVLADLDGDGDDDAFVTNGSNQANKVYLNDGSGNYIDTGVSLGSGVTTEAVLIDLDGDGDLDAFVANSAGRNKVYFNDGLGYFTDSGQNIGFTTNNSISIDLGDLDGDGDPDVVIGNYFQYFQIFFNNGNGFFGNQQQIAGNYLAYGIKLGYLNNDNHLDIFAAQNNSMPNKVYFNNGNGTFSNSGQNLGNGNSNDVELLDLNGDTYVDAFVANTNGPNKVWLNDGTGNFSNTAQNLGNAQSGNVEFADFNNDNILDAWIGNTNSASKIYLSDGNATFTDSGLNIPALSGDLALSDVDGDGDTDIFAIKSGPNQVWLNEDLTDNCGYTVVLSQDSFSCTDVGQTIPVAVTVSDAAGNSISCTSNVTVSDNDNPCPQPPTAICQNLSLTADANCQAMATAADFDNGSSDPDGGAMTFSVSPTGPYASGTTLVTFTVTDIDGDTSTCSASVTVNDVTAPTVTCQDITVQLDANGMISITENDVLLPNVAIWQFTDSGQGLGPSSHGARVILEDFDNDGDKDAFVVNLSNQPNTVWMNDGLGNFSNSGQNLGSGESHGVAASDLDMDGDLDVFVGNTSLEPNKIWLNNGLGIFTDSGQSLNALNSDVILLGDLDADGDDDAFVVNFYGSKVWLNDGSAVFTNTGQHLSPSYSYGADMADLDADGDLDAFVSSRLVPSRVWLNNGSGTFTDNGPITGTDDVEGVHLGDLDGDGDLDAFLSKYLGNEIWFNDGAAGFSNSGQSLGNSLSRDVKLSDVDGDGDLDAFVGNQGGNRVYINDGTGFFTNSGMFLGSGNTWGLDMADLDGDGDEDAFIANVGNPDRVWFNTTNVQVNNVDNCGPISYNLSPSSFNCAEVGQNIPVLVTATDASGNSSTCSSMVTVADDNHPCPVPPLALNVKLFFSGNYVTSINMMTPSLSTNGYLPSTQPFTAAPWNYAGTETALAATMSATGNDAVVDWILVELRDKNDNTIILSTQAALLLADGDVVDMDGTTLSVFQPADDYYISVKARNHLAALSLNTFALSASPTLVDFTTIPTYGTNAQKTINSIKALWSGDANGDGSIDATDRSIAWNMRNQSGYLLADFNMDGTVEATDRSIAWNHRNVGVQLP